MDDGFISKAVVEGKCQPQWFLDLSYDPFAPVQPHRRHIAHFLCGTPAEIPSYHRLGRILTLPPILKRGWALMNLWAVVRDLRPFLGQGAPLNGP